MLPTEYIRDASRMVIVSQGGEHPKSLKSLDERPIAFAPPKPKVFEIPSSSSHQFLNQTKRTDVLQRAMKESWLEGVGESKK